MPVIQCPACQQKLNVPDKLLGKRVKCPACGDGFEATPTSTQPEKPKKPAASTEAIAPAAKRPVKAVAKEVPEEEELTEPVYDDEDEIERRPQRKRSRQDNDDEDDRPSRRRRRRDDDDDDDDYDVRRRPRQAHRGGLILTLGIIGLVVWCCPIAGWVVGGITMNMAKTDLAAMSAGRMDKSGHGLTMAGNICAIITVVLASINAIGGLILRLTGNF